MIRTPVGIGLMGCGRIAESVHVPIVTRLATARLVAAANTSAKRRAWLGRHVTGRAAPRDLGITTPGFERGSGDLWHSHLLPRGGILRCVHSREARVL